MMLTTLTSCVVIASIGAKLFLQMASLRADEETSDLIPTTNATEIPLGGNKCHIFFISLNSSKFRENSIYFLFSGISRMLFADDCSDSSDLIYFMILMKIFLESTKSDFVSSSRKKEIKKPETTWKEKKERKKHMKSGYYIDPLTIGIPISIKPKNSTEGFSSGKILTEKLLILFDKSV